MRPSKGLLHTLNAMCSRKNPAPLFFSDSYLLPQPIQRPTCQARQMKSTKNYISRQVDLLLSFLLVKHLKMEKFKYSCSGFFNFCYFYDTCITFTLFDFLFRNFIFQALKNLFVQPKISYSPCMWPGWSLQRQSSSHCLE